MPRRLLVLTVALLITLPSAAYAVKTSARVIFVDTVNYKVVAKIGDKRFTGRGQLPDGWKKRFTAAKAPADTLGDQGREVVVAHGVDADGTRAYALFTIRQRQVQKLLLGGLPAIMLVDTKGKSTVGFRCAQGKLIVTSFEADLGEGAKQTFKLDEEVLKFVDQTAINQPQAADPASCF